MASAPPFGALLGVGIQTLSHHFREPYGRPVEERQIQEPEGDDVKENQPAPAVLVDQFKQHRGYILKV